MGNFVILPLLGVLPSYRRGTLSVPCPYCYDSQLKHPHTLPGRVMAELLMARLTTQMLLCFYILLKLILLKDVMVEEIHSRFQIATEYED